MGYIARIVCMKDEDLRSLKINGGSRNLRIEGDDWKLNNLICLDEGWLSSPRNWF